MFQELDKEEVRPVTPDLEAKETVIRAISEEAAGIRMIQDNLIQAQDTQDLLEEKEFYAEVRDNHRQKEKAIDAWKEYISRTSNYQFLTVSDWLKPEMTISGLVIVIPISD